MDPDKSRQSQEQYLQQLRREIRQLNATHPYYQARRAELLRNISIVKHNLQPARNSRPKRQAKAKTTNRPARKNTQAKAPTTSPKRQGLAQILTPEKLTESLKTVGSLRTFVKNCAQYLQQADQMLDTLYITSTSLRESGVLEKLIKQKGKNLTTEDFTNVLVALMNSPIGGQLFKAMGSGSDASTETDNTNTTSQ